MNATNVSRRARRARRIGFAAWGALLVLECLWHAWWDQPLDPPALVLAVVPLLLPLFAMRRPMRALLWAGIVAVFYFAHGVSEAWTTPAWRAPAIMEAVLSASLVCALALGLPKHHPARNTDPPAQG